MSVGWLQAFRIVLAGVPIGSVKVEKWKQILLSLSIVWTLSSPEIKYYMSLPYQGSIPSQNSITKVVGDLRYQVDQRGSRESLQVVLVKADGKRIEFQDPNGLESVREWERETGVDQVYVEGFFLRDGDGFFWPTYMTTINGEPLLTREEQLRKLEVAREPFGKLLLVMYILVAPMWLISVVNVKKIKNAIGA